MSCAGLRGECLSVLIRSRSWGWWSVGRPRIRLGHIYPIRRRVRHIYPVRAGGSYGREGEAEGEGLKDG